LNIELENTSRTFQEILFRKTGYTNFLDKLKAKLLECIEKIEERRRERNNLFRRQSFCLDLFCSLISITMKLIKDIKGNQLGVHASI